MLLRRLASILFLFLVFMFLSCGKSSEESPDSPFDFSLPDLKGKLHSLKEFKGKMILLNFWATWCPVCKEDIATLFRIYKEYKDSGLEVIGVSLDKKGLGIVDSFVREFNIPYTILLGDETVVKNFGSFKGLPTTFLLEKRGRIVKRYSGQINQDSLETDLKSWIGK